jgi:hypothetical protein
MQHRYVGDFGDYVKLGILRAIASGRRLGIAWWLYRDEVHNKDGKHTKYLDEPDRWKAFDPALFEKLKTVGSTGNRHISLLEDLNILPGAVFASEPILVSGPSHQRTKAREIWFSSVLRTLASADLVFVDPDNGIQPENFSLAKKKAGKAVSYEELRALALPDRPLVVYHHQTRRKGGHLAEISHLTGLFRENGFKTVDAIRAPNYSPRVFFILNGSLQIRERAASLTEKWKGALSWHPDK